MNALEDYDLDKRLYKITEYIQQVAVKRRVSVVLIRNEVIKAGQFSASMLSMLEKAMKGDKKARKLQLKQEIRLNAYFRKQLNDPEICIMQMQLDFT